MINIRKELGIKIPKFKEILNPTYIYIPLKVNKPHKIKEVFIGEKLEDTNISISGRIKFVARAKDKNYLVIENNYLEKYIPYNKVLDIPSYIYVNCLDKDPFSYNNYYILLKEYDIIYKICNYLLDNGCQKIVFIIPEYFKEQMNLYNEILNKKILFKIVDEYYPLAYPSILSKYINIEESHLINLESFLDYYYNNIRNIIRDTKYITINDGVNPTVLKVKLYTIVNDYLDDYPDKDNIILNNSLNGNKVDKTNVINNDTDNLLLLKKNYSQKKCLNCGLCTRICVSKDKCLHCGLCKYVCPAKRD